MDKTMVCARSMKNIIFRTYVILLFFALMGVYCLCTYTEGFTKPGETGDSLSSVQKESTQNELIIASPKRDAPKTAQEIFEPTEFGANTKGSSSVSGIHLSDLSFAILLVFLLCSVGLNIYFLLRHKILGKNTKISRDFPHLKQKKLSPQRIIRGQEPSKFKTVRELVAEASRRSHVTLEPKEVEEKQKFEEDESMGTGIQLTLEEMIRRIVQRYNDALSSNKEKREKFQVLNEPKKVSILNPEELKKGDYMDVNFKPEFTPNEQGDLLLVEIDNTPYIFPTFDIDIFHYYSLRSCFDLEKSEKASMQRTMVQELKEPAKCEQKSAETWKLEEKGKVVISS